MVAMQLAPERREIGESHEIGARIADVDRHCGEYRNELS
jgi:hypothetical protein